jgi:hypothetical protein
VVNSLANQGAAVAAGGAEGGGVPTGGADGGGDAGGLPPPNIESGAGVEAAGAAGAAGGASVLMCVGLVGYLTKLTDALPLALWLGLRV